MRKMVLCGDCGFLCWSVSDSRDEFGVRVRWGEVLQSDRKAIIDGTIKAIEEIPEFNEYHVLSCLRKQWIWSPGNTHPKYNFVGIQNLQNPRRCLYFTNYEPAFGPEEHKDLKLKRETRRETRNVALLAAGIGGLISTIGNILFNIFT